MRERDDPQTCMLLIDVSLHRQVVGFPCKKKDTDNVTVTLR